MMASGASKAISEQQQQQQQQSIVVPKCPVTEGRTSLLLPQAPKTPVMPVVAINIRDLE